MAQVTINKRQLQKTRKKFKELEAPLTRGGANKLGKIIVNEMKKDISRGQSPIRGKGKFPALQEPYKTRKKNLGKGNKPNLELFGQFLKSLVNAVTKNRSGYSAVVKFSNETARKKEQGHREGANGQKKRPIIPTGQEGFNKRISDIIFNFMNSTVGDIVRKK